MSVKPLRCTVFLQEPQWDHQGKPPAPMLLSVLEYRFARDKPIPLCHRTTRRALNSRRIYSISGGWVAQVRPSPSAAAWARTSSASGGICCACVSRSRTYS